MVKWFKSWLKKKLQKYNILEQKKFDQWLLDTMQSKAIIAVNKKKVEYYNAGSMQNVNLCNELEQEIYTSMQDFKLKAIERYTAPPQEL